MKIRVILCAHNGARFIEAQLASIMDQTRVVDAVHVFDFASSDGTREMLQALAKRWPTLDVQLVDHVPGVTLSFFHAFTAVLPECAEDDVIFLSDQDDVWRLHKVETVVACIASQRARGHDHVLAFHDVQICDEALNSLFESFYEGRPFQLPRDIAQERLLVANPVIGHTIAVTKPLLALAVHCLRPAHYVMHDWALVLLAAYAGQIVQAAGQLGQYRQHDSNILGVGRKRSIASMIGRAIRLSRSIGVQVAAFAEDIHCVSRDVKTAVVLPGRGPVALRLGMVMAREGPTFGHRLMALLQFGDLLWARRNPRASQ
ncbi:MAG: glycosyltransferase [Sphingomonadales bacterium]